MSIIPRFLLPPGDLLDKLSAFTISFFVFILIVYERNFNTGIHVSVFGVFISLILILQIIKHRLKISIPITLAFVAFNLVVVILTMNSRVPEKSYDFLLFYAVLFAAYSLSYHLQNTHSRFMNWFVDVFLLIGGVICVISFVVQIPQVIAGERFVGPFYWHNQMAAFLMMLIPISVYKLIMSSRYKLIYIITFVFLVFLLLVTYSRSVWGILLFIVLINILIFRKFINIKKYIIFTSFATVLLLFTPFAEKTSTHVKSMFYDLKNYQTSYSTVSSRINLFKTAFAMYKDNSTYGVGPGVFGEAINKYQSRPWFYARNTHNQFLQILAETGFLGFVTFFSIFTTIFVVIRKKLLQIIISVRKGFKKHYLVYVIGIIIISSFVHNLVDVDYTRLSLSTIYWVFIGIAAAYLTTPTVFEIKSHITKRLIFVLLSILFILSGINFYSKTSIQTALIYFSKGKYRESEKIFLKIVYIYPYSYSANFYLSEVADLNKNYEKALAYLTNAYANNQYASEPLYKMGVIKVKQGDFEGAMEYFLKAVQLNPYTNPKYYNALAEIHMLRGNIDKAEKVLEDAVDSFPIDENYKSFAHIYEYTDLNNSLLQTYLNYGTILARIGKDEQASNIIDQAKKLLPD